MQDTPLRQWLVGEWRDGFPVRHVRLEWCENAQRFDRETEWIGKFPKLVNDRKHTGWINLIREGGEPPKFRRSSDTCAATASTWMVGMASTIKSARTGTAS